MFKFNSVFHRKECSFETTPCVIEKIITLDGMEYDQFRKNMLANNWFIAENINDMFVDNNGVTHSLLVLGDNRDDGVAINSSGYDYARYSSFLPNAKQYVQNQITELADALIKDGTQNTSSGCWIVGFDEIKEHYDITVSPNNGIGTLLLEELQQREEVAEIIATEDCFEITYYLDNCPACHDGSERLQTLISMLGCNFEDVHLCDCDEEQDVPQFGAQPLTDVHLCDCDEEHDLATISVLNENTLTEQGKTDWADVLNAKVHRIYQGCYGLQLELSGCKPQRLYDFSMMLAGQCTAEDYLKWVNTQEDNIHFDNRQGVDDNPDCTLSM